jgi:hypothetical protein
MHLEVLCFLVPPDMGNVQSSDLIGKGIESIYGGWGSVGKILLPQ